MDIKYHLVNKFMAGNIFGLILVFLFYFSCFILPTNSLGLHIKKLGLLRIYLKGGGVGNWLSNGTSPGEVHFLIFGYGGSRWRKNISPS